MLWNVCFLSLADVYVCEVKTPNIFLVCMHAFPSLGESTEQQSSSGNTIGSFQSREAGTVPSPASP